MAKQKRTRRLERYGSALDLLDAEPKSPLAGLKMATITPKSRCCQKRVRCSNCPVVVHKLQRAVQSGEIDREALRQIAQRARMRA
ncbi:hypothetical protein KRX51_07020 [Corynebacterium sp. TAE3-ERU12]|uniref:hypothetical protein n=1 Tax=Corynebacterium sp. TAE3-ERU12 TaxID=2849491 RepID=UPI001C438742|nr:hypothetical protein [Corynebacterium sp. TAE3-ERU12]MBV7295665.1 hypothetical protein [Corynebacterium sp. TAE3-ERU12]